MALPSIFEKNTCDSIIQRIEKLEAHSAPLWGKMNASQMLAHCNVTYALAEGKVSSNNNAFTKLILKLFVKKIVTNEKPYPQNSRTAPVFLISDERDFQKEKNELIQNINKVQQQGATHFEGKVSDSFGNLTSREWNNLFYKHLNHHLAQFGV